MTLLYGKDSNGNQVPLLVDGSGVVQTSGGTAWPGTSSQLTAGDGTAVTVGSGLTLAAGTLTTSQMPAPASTAVNRWPMNESSGTTFTDSIASQVLTFAPLGASVLTYGANRVLAPSTSVNFALTASDTTSVLSCSSASFPTVSSAGQSRMIEAYLRFNNVPNPAGGNYIVFTMYLDANNRLVFFVNNGNAIAFSRRNNSTEVYVNGPSLSASFGAFGNNRSFHMLVTETGTNLSFYINGQVYSGTINSLYSAGTYTLSLCSDFPATLPTSVEIAEITLHNGLIPTGYASTQAYATARAMLLDRRR